MVEDAVKDHVDVQLLRRGQEPLQRRVPTESFVHLHEIIAVISMVGVRVKDRVEVDRVHADGDEMRQAEANAVKITTVEVFTLRWRCWNCVPRDDGGDPLVARLRAAIVQWICVAESVGEDLIHNRTAQEGAGGEPFWRDNDRPITAHVGWRDTAEALIVDVVIGELDRCGAVRNHKVVADRCGLTPNVDAGAPHIAEGIGELIRRVKHGIRSEEGAQLAACPSGGLVDFSAGDAPCDADGGALRRGSAKRRGYGECNGDGVVRSGADLQHDRCTDLHRTTREPIGGVTRVVANQELLQLPVTPDLCGRVGRVARWPTPSGKQCDDKGDGKGTAPRRGGLGYDQRHYGSERHPHPHNHR